VYITPPILIASVFQFFMSRHFASSPLAFLFTIPTVFHSVSSLLTLLPSANDSFVVYRPVRGGSFFFVFFSKNVSFVSNLDSFSYLFKIPPKPPSPPLGTPLYPPSSCFREFFLHPLNRTGIVSFYPGFFSQGLFFSAIFLYQPFYFGFSVIKFSFDPPPSAVLPKTYVRPASYNAFLSPLDFLRLTPASFLIPDGKFPCWLLFFLEFLEEFFFLHLLSALVDDSFRGLFLSSDRRGAPPSPVS